MADDTDKGDPAKGDPDTKDKPLGDAGEKALAAERKARREAEAALKDVQAQLQQLTDKDKSELDKLRDENAQLKAEAADAATRALRLEVAAEKGVKARWLTGATREELEAAAD
jgi:hypothetical protein